MVIEFLPMGSLQDFVTKNGTLSTKQAISVARDIASGMGYLASNKIVHRDLAARNILLKDEGDMLRAKVTDFGLSNQQRGRLTAKDIGHGEGVSVRWAAPEVLTSAPLYTVKSDVWAFAVVLWEMFNPGVVPFQNLSTEQVIVAVKNGEKLGAPPENVCPPYLYLLMTECWSEDPEERPTFKEIASKLNTIVRQSAIY